MDKPVTTSGREAEFNLLMKIYEVVFELADTPEQEELHERLCAMNVARRAEREKNESECYDL